MFRPLGKKPRIGSAIRAAVGIRVAELIQTHARIGSGDGAEAVHVARVAVRSTRACLYSFRNFIDVRWRLQIDRGLKLLGDDLGRVRDLDVLCKHLEEERAILPESDRAGGDEALASFRRRREAEWKRLCAQLQEAWCRNLLERLATAADIGPPMRFDGQLSLSTFAHILLKRPSRRFRRALKGATEGADVDELHRVRIAARRLRFAVELLQKLVPHYAKRRARRSITALTLIQECLGALHDAVAESEALHAAAQIDRLIVGEFIGVRAATTARRRKEWGAERGSLPQRIRL